MPCEVTWFINRFVRKINIPHKKYYCEFCFLLFSSDAFKQATLKWKVCCILFYYYFFYPETLSQSWAKKKKTSAASQKPLWKSTRTFSQVLNDESGIKWWSVVKALGRRIFITSVLVSFWSHWSSTNVHEKTENPSDSLCQPSDYF